MEKEKKPINYPRKIARILLKSLLFLFLFIVFVFLLVLTPPVQRFMTGKVEGFLQNKLKTRVEIGSISFGLSGNVNLKDVYLEDRSKDTLLSGGSLKAHLNFVKLFSNEVLVKDLELQNITAKVKRVLPDTVFNFQFIVDAFAPATQTADTSAVPMKLDISNISLDNVKIVYADAVTGSDVYAHIGNLTATMDTLDPYTQHFDIPSIIARNVTAKIRQVKPLVDADPISEDLVDAGTPPAMKLNLGNIDLSKINIDYGNDVSAFYTTINLGQLKTKERLLDLVNNKIYFDELALNNSKVAIRFGKKEEAVIVKKEVSQEVEAQKQVGWDIKVASIQLDNNKFLLDDDTKPALSYGMDYAHLSGDSLTLHVEDFVMNQDSIGGKITKGSLREKSGFDLDALTGEVMYAYNHTYLKDLYIKTPGTAIQRNAEMRYASYDALVEDFPKTVFDIEFVNSRVQVKDILVFAPQLRSNAAFNNPDDIWFLNIVGTGTLDHLNFESLQFDGLRNTQLDASGTLAGLTNPQQAGGNFTINRFHTTQTDLALFTGQRLSTAQIKIPEEFTVTGTIAGNSGKLSTNLNISTTEGFVAVNGSFSNLTNPNAIVYNTAVTTRSLRLGSILRQPQQIGSLTGSFRLNGKGLTPDAIDARFTGTINSFGYNRYQYQNIKASGSLRGSSFTINADVDDRNADARPWSRFCVSLSASIASLVRAGVSEPRTLIASAVSCASRRTCPPRSGTPTSWRPCSASSWGNGPGRRWRPSRACPPGSRRTASRRSLPPRPRRARSRCSTSSGPRPRRRRWRLRCMPRPAGTARTAWTARPSSPARRSRWPTCGGSTMST